MLGKTYDSQVCSIARTLELVGERWSLLIVRDALFAGSTRFTDFQRNLGIATNILRNRLDGFVEHGIMQRHRYSEQPELFEYVLTDKGRALAPALIALTAWGDEWAAPDGPPLQYRHTVCGSELTPQTVCARCGTVHDPAEIRAVPGPGMPTDRADILLRMQREHGLT
ncbi:helix-turn-helix domain-containing protein [Nocardia sp. JMUB6875]|uniref:winged helix-turn-helix transcriptional regulator n=1 Tax=Nocardia sp. JMUB6875 TaxID=3158170 RepID=UPI0032E68F9D